MSTRPTRRDFVAGGGGALAGLLMSGGGAAVADNRQKRDLAHASPSGVDPTDVLTIGSTRLQRVYHNSNLIPNETNAAFGNLLWDPEGNLVLHDRTKTWLYTSTNIGDNWVSDVREFDTKTLATGPKTSAMGVVTGDLWTVTHDVIEVTDSLYVAFYSTSEIVKASVSDSPNGTFTRVPGFEIPISQSWEGAGSLESDCGHVKIGESSGFLDLWVLYDSLHDGVQGQTGWARVRINKQTGNVEFLGKRADNPLNVLPKDYIAARCGGNLTTSVRFDDKYTFIYLTRGDEFSAMLNVALSSDPLFQNVTDIVPLELPLGDEQVFEKFTGYVWGNHLYLLYEDELASGNWGTGVRVYRILT